MDIVACAQYLATCTTAVAPRLRKLFTVVLVLFAPSMLLLARWLFTRRAFVELATGHSSEGVANLLMPPIGFASTSVVQALKRWWRQLVKLQRGCPNLYLASRHRFGNAVKLLTAACVSCNFTRLTHNCLSDLPYLSSDEVLG